MTNTKLEFWETYREHTPTLLLVDLEGDFDTWHEVLSELKITEPQRSVVAFGPHSDVKNMELANDLGCNQVLSKGAFTRDLQKLLEEYTRPITQ